MKTLAAIACLVLLVGCHSHAPIERGDEVTLRGNPVTLVGEPVEVGDAAPDFVAVAQDMSEKKLSDYRGKFVVL